MKKLRLKRHGTFHIRDGWMEKALNAINENADGKSIFRKEVGVANLGIGSMMVTSLRYWMIASEIINEKDSQLTDFGRLLIEYDRYLDESFSWWMIHLHLVSNFNDSPVFNVVFIVDEFCLPQSDIGRTIIEIKKEKQTQNKYPRKSGIPSKEPIK